MCFLSETSPPRSLPITPHTLHTYILNILVIFHKTSNEKEHSSIKTKLKELKAYLDDPIYTSVKLAFKEQHNQWT